MMLSLKTICTGPVRADRRPVLTPLCLATMSIMINFLLDFNTYIPRRYITHGRTLLTSPLFYYITYLGYFELRPTIHSILVRYSPQSSWIFGLRVSSYTYLYILIFTHTFLSLDS